MNQAISTSTSKIKPFTANITIADVKFKCDPIGKLIPIPVFEPTEILEKHGLQFMVLKDIGKAFDDGFYSSGTTAVVDFDEDLNPNFKEINRSAAVCDEFPTKCPSCDRDLKLDYVYWDRDCTNKVCPGTARGFLYRFINCVNPLIRLSVIKKYLDNYCVADTIASMDTLGDFRFAFQALKNKNTIGRLNHWKSTKLKEYETLWQLDCQIQEYLERPILPVRDFWNTCNFPKITDEQLGELYSVKPDELIEGNYPIDKLSNGTRHYVDDNLDLIMFLNKFFTTFEEKQWIG